MFAACTALFNSEDPNLCSLETSDNKFLVHAHAHSGAVMLLDHENGTIGCYSVPWLWVRLLCTKSVCKQYCATEQLEEKPQCYCVKW